MVKFLLGFFSFGWLRGLDFLPPLLLRLFLAPLLWVSGSKKLGLFAGSDIVWYNPMTWFDAAGYQAGVEALSTTPMPLPSMMNGVIGGVEVAAAFLLIIGLAVRWISLPLLALMGFAVLLALGGGDVVTAAKNMLMTHGYTDATVDQLTLGVMYFIMVLSLFFMGAGRFSSVDWFLHRKLQRSIDEKAGTTPESYDNDPFNVDATMEDKKI
ncbi:MAG: DoxX family protein [Cocleimonas sp.]|nr:DoxX family protein [Cocleimonas sp.]